MGETDETKVDQNVENKKEEKPASFGTAVISLVNSTLGAGMLGIPLAYAKAGLVPAIILHLLMGVLSWISFYFLTYAAEATGMYTYGDLAENIFGVWGTIIVEVCNFSYTFGPLWSYCILIGDFIPSVLRGVGVPADNIFCQRWFIIIIIAFILIQPLSWLQSLNSLRFTSFFGMISMMFCVVVIVIRFCSPFDDQVNHEYVEAVRPSPSMIQTFSTLCFAFGCQQNVPIIQGEIHEKSTKSMLKITLISVSIVGFFYMMAGIFGYIQFTQMFFDNKDTSGNILTLYNDRDWLVFAARIASLVTVVFCCPMNSLPARIALFNIINAVRRLWRERNSHPKSNRVRPYPESADYDSTRPPSQVELMAEGSQSPYPTVSPTGTPVVSTYEEVKETGPMQLELVEHPDAERRDKENNSENLNEQSAADKELGENESSSDSGRVVVASYESSPHINTDSVEGASVHYAPEDDEEALKQQRELQNKRGDSHDNGDLEREPDWYKKKYGCLTGKTWLFSIIGSCMVALAVVLAIFLSQVNFVFDFLGSTAGVAVAFLIPSMMYWRIITVPERFVNEHRNPNTTRPEGIEEFLRRTAQMKKKVVGCSCGVFLAWLTFWCGIVFGIFSLAMAIIFDTSLADKVDW
ncbi:putative AminoAcid/AuxinPermease(AAAP) Family Protein [Monocercomonoides exilis]|uniref:putative AminoAcid/AuxinPermease(AAAP) Family Protein n=1 Tax=Monocercomonoides exilis TaxID=2049356 RepID=UPI00355A62DC|nr:putative AminoAcid/AuxinPermease(AAAP) Family Protein [Monocercomonoides exilis]|eukprot:MONOS_9389.1-p1 / transcript=MONOS_9389.1 / gene=MONOS_9389 / organism=Monocercomonoides_exilis_PA203 / gene_product=AminoAcid/AuxinPermease(AAAP) Family Protein / transcript_product=AminoAcid/AuxinPermease(AAAP) Family Protein / location=Mono_scaffold00386:41814-43791(+) / protein_length=636 / sequence_SO=supercontig / SO=protein_coding / is_pseudo=false